MSQNETRRTVILTGASRGIGHATVKRFSSAGWRVITCSRMAFSEYCPWDAGPEDHIQIDLGDYDNLKAGILPRDPEVNHNHAARQAFIALGFAMLAAAELKVDCTPMEGFESADVDEILGLDKLGLRSVVLLPLGYRNPEDDWLLPMPKVRKSLETLVTTVD